VPGILTRIAETAGAGPTIATEQVVAGGATLYQHWHDGIAGARIAEKSWTHVVLQGQSFEPTGTDNEYFLSYAERFGRLATEAGARATWFVTWARSPAYFPSSQRAGRMQDELTSAYAEAARSVPTSLLACVGEAFRAVVARAPEIALHDPDQSHASLAGAYLAAATFYVSITGAPVPASSALPPGLDPAAAAKLREAAKVGSGCANVRVPADVTLYGEGFHLDDLGQPAKPGDFGTSATPVVRNLYLWNTGFAGAGLSAAPLAPPFAWTSGAYPGGAGVDPVNGLPFCDPVLAAGKRCALSVRYDGSANATSALTLLLAGAYQSEIVEPLRARTTDRAHLNVRMADPRTTTFVTVGVSSPFHAVVSNVGVRPASSIQESVGPAAPFAWSGAGVYPGGSGLVDVEGTTLDHCTSVLAAGSRCVLTFQVTAPAASKFYELPLELTFESSSAPAAPVVSDVTRTTLRVRSRMPPP